MRILKKARHSKIDVFVKFESAINLEIRGQIKKKTGFLLFGSQGPYSTARIHCPLTRRVQPARALILNI